MCCLTCVRLGPARGGSVSPARILGNFRGSVHRFIGILALSVFVASCGSDSATAPISTSIAGSYTLRTINGAPLPFIVLQVGADKVEVLNETVVVAEGGTFMQQGSLRVTEGGVVSTESYAETGTYTRNGTAITFVNSDGSSGTGTVNGATITISIVGFAFMYRK